MADPILGDLGNNTLTGTDAPELIAGDGTALTDFQTGGNDSIAALGGDDTVYGDAPTLTRALGGSDTIQGGDGADQLFGDAATVFPFGSGPGLPLPIGGAPDLVSGGAGDDTIWGDMATGVPTQAYASDTLRGDDGNDVIYGDFQTGDTFVHPVAGDLIEGGAGNDTLFGDSELSFFNVAQPGARDTVFGGDGDDVIYGDARTHAALEPGGRPTDISDVNDSGTSDELHGGAGNDLIIGDFGRDAFNGDGNDTITGDDGNDTIYGDGIDQQQARMGNDSIDGGRGNDLIYGDTAVTAFQFTSGSPPGSFDPSNSGSDLLRGGEGNDTLIGDATELPTTLLIGPPNTLILIGGPDTLEGGTGDDVLTGGLGKDTFLFHPGDGHDRVTDFTPGGDILRFEGVDPGSIATRSATEEGVAGLLVTYGSGGDQVFLIGVTALGSSDIVTDTSAPPGAVDWNAIAADVVANFIATGQWFATPAPGSPPPPLPETVDWNSVAAQVIANFQATGHWFV